MQLPHINGVAKPLLVDTFISSVGINSHIAHPFLEVNKLRHFGETCHICLLTCWDQEGFLLQRFYCKMSEKSCSEDQKHMTI